MMGLYFIAALAFSRVSELYPELPEFSEGPGATCGSGASSAGTPAACFPSAGCPMDFLFSLF